MLHENVQPLLIGTLTAAGAGVPTCQLTLAFSVKGE